MLKEELVRTFVQLKQELDQVPLRHRGERGGGGGVGGERGYDSKSSFQRHAYDAVFHIFMDWRTLRHNN